jgi:ComF family protein
MCVTDPRRLRPAAAAAPARPLAALLHLLLPSPCPGCGAALSGRPALGLCLACRGRLARHRPGCPRCGEPLPGGLRRADPCAGCRRHPPAFGRLLSPWRFEPPLVAAVHAFKFARCAHLGPALAAPLAAWLREHRHLGAADLVVPVPLHPWRRLRRGYNQAELLARPLAARLGLPFLDALVRRRSTPPQSRLPRGSRLRNVQDAFRPRHRHCRHLTSRHVLLVDDVATTGATLDAAARALKAAGARTVTAVTLARTPPPTDERRP